MKYCLTAFLLAALLCAPLAAWAQEDAAFDPFREVPAGECSAMEGVEIRDGAAVLTKKTGWIKISRADFRDGASLLRLQAQAEGRLAIRGYLDSMEGEPVFSTSFAPVTKQFKASVQIDGVHDLYFVLEGGGAFTSWQAFETEADIAAAIKAERGGDYEDQVPTEYIVRCDKPGSVEKFTYAAHDYINGGEAYEKTAFVYLPSGYDPQATYDLLILCHGIGGSEYEWGLSSASSRVKAIMDNLIARGEIRPFIVVTPNGRAGKTQDPAAFYRFGDELRNDLLPALAKQYAVDIHDRSRCAMAGLSMGGMQTMNIGIGECLDLFSAFGAFSACPTTNSAARTAATLNQHADLPVRMLYSICGTGDSIAYASATAAVKDLASLTSALNKDNYVEQYVSGGHDFGVWYLGFFNFARMIGK